MPVVNIREAKTNLAKLVDLALKGEEIIIARRGKPLVKLVPAEGDAGLRPIGLHRQEVSDDCLEEAMRPLDEEELEHWYKPTLLDDQ